MKIRFIPKKIKKELIANRYIKFYLKGHKNISIKKKINLVEFTNKNRLWLLREEVKK
uniref:Cytochrome b6-f complex subunit PetP n=1 Tax=Vertebrata thuyoides TaxID=2006970 RepID=A0A1Z1MAZ6_9FLOR|nr:cytochrome b6-f complex subunit PetP [Vertebrata thuyoides]ARW63139.1 cytochrome b6-f complex subunit PetP [Vertebrata thuyoides]